MALINGRYKLTKRTSIALDLFIMDLEKKLGKSVPRKYALETILNMVLEEEREIALKMMREENKRRKEWRDTKSES